MTGQNMTCSECRTDIPVGAKVCRGCHAEISYGTPGELLLVNAGAWVGIGFYLNSHFAWSNNISTVVAIGGFVATALLLAKVFKNDVRFTREKKQNK